MKRIKFFAVAVCLAICSGAYAQFTNTSSNSSSKTSSTSVNTDGWNTLWVEWNPSTFKRDIKNTDDESFTGLSLGYSHAFNITKSLPLYLEVGLGVQYSFKTIDLNVDEDDYEYGKYEDEDSDNPEIKASFLSAKIPVNLIYSFQIPNSTVKLMPFVGINMRYNISGKLKYKANLSEDEDKGPYGYGYNDWYDDDYDYDYPYEDRDISVNVFDKKDMGGEKYTWKRFQLGWNIGLKARFGEKFLVGVAYGSDFSEICKKSKISTTSITLGYTF